MRTLILILVLVNLLIYSLILEIVFEPKSFIAFLDVGQGSAVLLKDGKNIFLYDTGKENSKILNEFRKNLPFYYKKLDLALISHPDFDHFGSLRVIKEKYKIRLLLTNPYSLEKDNFRKFIQDLKLSERLIFLKAGDRIKTNNFYLEILNPYKRNSNDNDNSLVIFVKYKNYSILLTGDISKKIIKEIVEKNENKIKNIDILLYPHHGSKYSLSEISYEIINPKIVVIQSGLNNYGHPHREVLDFFQKRKKIIWNTFVSSTLVVK